MLVVLDPGEMAVAQTLATLRHSVNTAAGVTDKRRDTTRDPNTTELMGVVGELAFCKAYNVWPDLSVVPRSGGHDAVLHGKTWDIKAVAKSHHRLLAHPDKNLTDVDRYGLAVVTDAVVELVGWAPADKLLHPSTVTDLGHGPVHALRPDQLQPFPQERP